MESKAGAGSMQSDEDVPDRISNLYDEIILRILSMLTMKEAAATSVLSRRWKYLWIASLTRLVFDKDTFSHMNSIAFRRMVNGVVRRFPEGAKLEEFCVRFRLSKSETHVDNWLDFALYAGATRVELNFIKKTHHRSYYVPIQLFRNQGNYTALKELFLIQANVIHHVFKAILSTCPSLECLVVVDDYGLRGAVKCNTPHLKLKRLTMECELLESLDIIAPNLVSCGYHTLKKTYNNYLNPPRLVSLKISYFSQLKCLTLDTTTILHGTTIMAGRNFTSLHNLTTLALVHYHQNSYQHTAIELLKASPRLQSFELHLDPCFYHTYVEVQLDMIPMTLHQNLKKFMFSGFMSYPGDMSFLRFIVEHTTDLACVEVTTSFVKYSEIDRDGAYKQAFRENRFIYNRREYFGGLRAELHQMLPSNISWRLLDDEL